MYPPHTLEKQQLSDTCISHKTMYTYMYIGIPIKPYVPKPAPTCGRAISHQWLLPTAAVRAARAAPPCASVHGQQGSTAVFAAVFFQFTLACHVPRMPVQAPPTCPTWTHRGSHGGEDACGLVLAHTQHTAAHAPCHLGGHRVYGLGPIFQGKTLTLTLNLENPDRLKNYPKP